MVLFIKLPWCMIIILEVHFIVIYVIDGVVDAKVSLR